MGRILMPLPALDVDPTEAAVSWAVLTRLGHDVIFATPDGQPAQADTIMVTGRGLDPWGFVPGLRRLALIGRVLGTNRDARAAHAAMAEDPAWRAPIRWEAIAAGEYDGLLLPGGHRARGMRPYLESAVLQAVVARFFALDRPVAAVCHGVLLVARSKAEGSDHSVLYGRRTTALTWSLEGLAARIGRVVRFWDPAYYRTYPDGPGEPAGYMSVQQEVTRALAAPGDFLDVPADAPDRAIKIDGRHRDSWDDDRPAFFVEDGRYLSARWPGDVHGFARRFAAMVAAAMR